MPSTRSYLKDFDFDLFISYCHYDNLKAPGEARWVDEFHEALAVKLAKVVGALPRIWRDKDLDGTQVVDHVIEARVQKSAMFLALISKSYTGSDYCCHELSVFAEAARRSPYGLEFNQRNRIIRVNLMNVPEADCPEETHALRTNGFTFHNPVESNQLGEPSQPGTETFKQGIRTLAESIALLLDDLKQASAGRPVPERKPLVFVGYTSDSLQDDRERLCADLTRQGVAVCSPAIPPPWASKEHTASVARALGTAALSVHLLDAFPGRRIEDEPLASYPTKQVEIALTGSLPQLIWVPATLDIPKVSSDSYRGFLQKLESGEASAKEYEFIRESNQRLDRLVIEKLQTMTSSSPPARDDSFILLDTHLKDQRYAFKLGEYLLDGGLQPLIVQETDDPESGLLEFERKLAMVKKLVILFGSVSQRWVERRLECVLQFVARQPSNARRTLESCFVYLLPPEKRAASSFGPSILRINILDNSMSDLFRPEVAAPLFGASAAGGVR